MAKLERPEALQNLDEILEASDGIMVARGDLGVELPFEQVPIVQKRILVRATQRGLQSSARMTEERHEQRSSPLNPCPRQCRFPSSTVT